MKKFLFIEYPKCSTCQKARRWLDEHGVDYTARHIVEQTPSVEELTEWMSRSTWPVSRFFNTSGLQYRALQLKEKLPTMNAAEQIKLLASNGMLIKRPLVIGKDTVLAGFKPTEWSACLLHE